MNKAKKVGKILRKESLKKVYQRSKYHIKRDFLYAFLDPVCKFLLPKYKKFEIGGVRAKFERLYEIKHTCFPGGKHDEEKVIEDLLSEIGKNDIFYDIGAYMGVYSSFASNLIKSGKIVAFEPNPFHINILHKNIGSNTENYEIYNMALGREKGVVKITPNLSSGSNIKEKNSKINIKKTSIKNMVKKGYIEKPNIVKIDVEGSELDVIRGFKSIIKEVNVMYVEVHRKRSKKFGYKEKQIMDILNENFGGVWKINEIERSGGKQVHVKAK